jgi:antitoxin component YwqK of YwqJK toxin-antitoxin module
VFVLLSTYGQDTLLNQYDSDNLKTGKWVEHWTDTKRMASIEYFIKGKRNGLCKYYNSAGIIIEESEYVNDSINGISKVYSATGTLREIAEFKNGRKEGFTRSYTYKGVMVYELEYHNNMLNGEYKIFHTSGRLAAIRHYINGLENGTSKSYRDNKKNELYLEMDYVNEKRIETRYYKKGKLIKTEKGMGNEEDNK